MALHLDLAVSKPHENFPRAARFLERNVAFFQLLHLIIKSLSILIQQHQFVAMGDKNASVELGNESLIRMIGAVAHTFPFQRRRTLGCSASAFITVYSLRL